MRLLAELSPLLASTRTGVAGYRPGRGDLVVVVDIAQPETLSQIDAGNPESGSWPNATCVDERGIVRFYALYDLRITSLEVPAIWPPFRADGSRTAEWILDQKNKGLMTLEEAMRRLGVAPPAELSR